jgi:hypothetical protein
MEAETVTLFLVALWMFAAVGTGSDDCGLNDDVTHADRNTAPSRHASVPARRYALRGAYLRADDEPLAGETAAVVANGAAADIRADAATRNGADFLRADPRSDRAFVMYEIRPME